MAAAHEQHIAPDSPIIILLQQLNPPVTIDIAQILTTKEDLQLFTQLVESTYNQALEVLHSRPPIPYNPSAKFDELDEQQSLVSSLGSLHRRLHELAFGKSKFQTSSFQSLPQQPEGFLRRLFNRISSFFNRITG
jgi:hypothetical protein